ncbi:MAG TPA: LysR family transcriptional regulator [Candidatus Ornithoclostridium faecavium]|nr:LysR family transcriptional regulator [Candidatus Ornithoclostridium faecavium]
MDIKELKYFIAVAECGSISKAAEKLFTTQPNLSRQLMKLEEETGQKLLIRGNKKSELTEAGRLLYKRATEITELMDRTQSELRSDGDEVFGTVCIGGGESYAVGLIAKAAKEVSDMFPGIKFDFFSGDTDAVTEKLDKGLIDFGILIEPSNLEKYNSLRLPLTDKWGILMRKDSPLSEKEYITKEDLNGLPLLFSVHSFKKNNVTAWFCKDLDKLNVVATYNLIYNASLMVEQGMGYAVGLKGIINTSGDSTLCFRPFFPILETHLDVAWKKNGELSKASKIFLERLISDLSENVS